MSIFRKVIHMPRGKPLRNANGYGSVVKLSGNRRKPFEVRVNTRMDERYYPVYDVLGRFATREEGMIALAEYNKNPYSVSDRGMTFSQLYEKFYKKNMNTAARPIPEAPWIARNLPTSIAAHYMTSHIVNYGLMIFGVFLARSTAMESPSPMLFRSILKTCSPRWINMPCRMIL